jgi:hypothetical protein
MRWLGFDGNMYEKKLKFTIFKGWYTIKLSGKKIVVQKYSNQNTEEIIMQGEGSLVQRS